MTGRSPKGYRKVRKSVRRKLLRHMQVMGMEQQAVEYCSAMMSSPERRRQYDRLTAVTISRFFRDRFLWECLEREILPELLARKGETVRIWSAGCACGEEPYSVSILIREAAEHMTAPSSCEILGTDIMPACLERARRGVYTRSSLKEVSKERLERHFIHLGPDSFAIADVHRRAVRFLEHDFLEDPFPPACHLILARNNMFTYFSQGHMLRFAESIDSALLPGGFVVLGSHEKFPEGCASFAPLPGRRMIWVRSRP